MVGCPSTWEEPTEPRFELKGPLTCYGLWRVVTFHGKCTPGYGAGYSIWFQKDFLRYSIAWLTQKHKIQCSVKSTVEFLREPQYLRHGVSFVDQFHQHCKKPLIRQLRSLHAVIFLHSSVPHHIFIWSNCLSVYDFPFWAGILMWAGWTGKF